MVLDYGSENISVDEYELVEKYITLLGSGEGTDLATSSIDFKEFIESVKKLF